MCFPKISFLLLCAAIFVGTNLPVAAQTFTNPLNLDYRFSIEGKGSFREAADPVIVLFKNDYYLFASKCGGYWWSSDFKNWNFVTPEGLDIEKYAPSVFILDGVMHYTSSSNGAIYKTTDPKSGKWEYISQPHNWNDPWIFVDDDRKVYAYFGSGEAGGISVAQLDPDNKFKPIGNDILCFKTNDTENGFEVNGENNEKGKPWTEGASLLKYKGKYYLTYATPGTENRSYSDAYYVSDSPTGPFVLGKNSPLTRRGLGFVTGTGHGGLFFDKEGKLWTVVTAVIRNKAFFERRLAVFPAEITEDGLLYANTVFGDYPQYLPDTHHRAKGTDNLVGWNLLSKDKKVTTSSVFEKNIAENAVDENIKTSWSAATGNAGEWLQLDLGKTMTVNAIQSNFSDVATTYMDGRKEAFSTRYIIEVSNDGKKWKTIIDKSKNDKDQQHDYVALDKPINTRFLKITNKGKVPGYGKFALSDFRVFGNANGIKPASVNDFKAIRNQEDRRVVVISWSPVANVSGYVIRYGIAPDKLWNHYQIMNGTSWDVRSLIKSETYYFRIDTYNESGVTEGTKTIKVE